MTVRVTGLNVFPIKSCHALQVEEVQVDSRGVVDDRRFMLVDGNGRFLSQRKFPKLATVRSKFITDAQNQRLLHVSAPGMDSDLTFLPVTSGERLEVGIWEDRVKAVDQGNVPAAWFAKFIGHGGTFTRLVSTGDSSHSSQTTSPLTPPQGTTASNGGSNDVFQRQVTNLPLSLRGRLPPVELGLADAGPVSLVSAESLEDVNRRLRERECSEVALDRFRMNIEVSGCSAAFEEDGWLLVRIGGVPFLVYTSAEVRRKQPVLLVR